MTYGEYFLYFSAGAFWGVIIFANGTKLWLKYKARHSMSKLDKMIADLKQAAEDAIKNNKLDTKIDREVETHVLSWRHKGEMHQVKIIIDPALDDIGSEEDFEEMVKRGDAGKLQELLDGNLSENAKENIAEQEAFVFSRRSVEHMKEVGMSPDEAVTRILKAAGRMD